MASNDSVQGGTVETRKTSASYERPRIEKSRRLAEITGQGAVVPSGAPVPPPVDG
jgi:hypothetical protein